MDTVHIIFYCDEEARSGYSRTLGVCVKAVRASQVSTRWHDSFSTWDSMIVRQLSKA